MTNHDDLIRQIEDALNRLKSGGDSALGDFTRLVGEGSLDINVGDISESTAVAIGRNINQVINQTNISTEAFAFLDRMLRQPAICAAIEAQQQGGHIFLSYSRQDAEEAQRIRTALEAAGHTVWQDVTALKGGTEWMQSIERGIDSCYALVSVVSKDANQSEWVQIEYLHAKRRKKLIVPIKIDDYELPTMMLATHVIFAQDDLESGIAELLDVLPDAPEGQSQVRQQQQTVDRRALEIRYLDKVLLEHSVWQEVYTPMAGVAQIRRPEQSNGRPKMVTTPNSIQPIFRERINEKLGDNTLVPTEQREYNDILSAVEEMKQLVILGDPGSGKTTTLWRIAADYADRAKADPESPLPVFVRFGEMNQYTSLGEAIAEQLGDLAPYTADLMSEGRLALLLDGLNELPKDKRAENVEDAKALVEGAEEAGTVAVVTCRELDYTGSLDIGIDDRVTVEPLDPVRIHRFIEGYIQEPEEAADRLFWELAGDEAWDSWLWFKDQIGGSLSDFWNANKISHSKWRKFERRWQKWLEVRQAPRNLIKLTTNPYMLYMMVQVFTEVGYLPDNQGELFNLFINFLLSERERLDNREAQILVTKLANLGYAMQTEGEGTTFTYNQALRHLESEESLYYAKSAGLLNGENDIRFSHQLLQEYFAAYRMQTEMEAGRSAEMFFPNNSWWTSTGWEETSILLAGLYSDNCTPIINWLKNVQPEITSRCIVESGAFCPEETILSLQRLWIPRLLSDKDPRARSSISRALGKLKVNGLPLDNRPGISVDAYGLPDIEWVQIPRVDDYFMRARESLRLEEIEIGPLSIESFKISKYPITYIQYQCFIEAEDGFRNPEWWKELQALGHKLPSLNEQAYKFFNHPRERVSWWEAVAFCQWLSTKIGFKRNVIRLPTEWEWQWAAIGDTDWNYPYGNEFNKAYSNTKETGVGSTNAVGIFPGGDSPFHVSDMSGNVFEWCLNEYDVPENTDIASDKSRVVRGGTYSFKQEFARANIRRWGYPDYSLPIAGFRPVFQAST